MSAYCYINGDIRPVAEAAIGITDLGLQRGYAVFDFIRTYNNKLFHFEDHLRRFHRSATGYRLAIPLSDARIFEIAVGLIAKSQLEQPGIRLVLTGGYQDNSTFIAQPNFIMIAEELPRYDEDMYTNGSLLLTAEYQREMPGIKSTNYVHSILLEQLRLENKAIDLLYYFGNQVSECPRSSFFIFRDDTLVTSMERTLAGITRNLVLQMAGDLFAVEERAIAVEELHTLDEVFITSTTKRIVPIVQIDAITIGSGTVGRRTRTIMQRFEDYTSSY